MRSITNNVFQRIAPILESDLSVTDHQSYDRIAERSHEHNVIAEDQFRFIRSLFQHSPLAAAILAGFADGLTGPEIQQSLAITPDQFRATVRQIRRVLAIRGLYE
jgi:hypothetical protein